MPARVAVGLVTGVPQVVVGWCQVWCPLVVISAVGVLTRSVMMAWNR
jgi:hypothetical protein